MICYESEIGYFKDNRHQAITGLLYLCEGDENCEILVILKCDFNC